MAKLNQIIAVVNGKKKAATDALTQAYHQIQKTGLFDGIAKAYKPKDDEGERLPPEQKLVQVKAGDLIDEVIRVLSESLDCVAIQDKANCEALVQITPEMPPLPVTYLLFLEKQLVDVSTFIGKLPVLDPGEKWEYQEESDCYTAQSETTRTKKVPKAFVKYEATKEHPAQVDVFNEDVLVGYWTTTKLSGAIPAAERNAMLERCGKMKEAVVKAREEANSIEVKPVEIGRRLLESIFKGK